jgi:excisionase family DNA binding protein
VVERRELLTTGQVAERIGVSARTVASWVRAGKLTPTYVTMGGHARFDWTDVERQLREQRETDG